MSSDKATLSDISKAISAFETERDNHAIKVRELHRRIEQCNTLIAILLKVANKMEGVK